MLLFRDIIYIYFYILIYFRKKKNLFPYIPGGPVGPGGPAGPTGPRSPS